MHFDFGLKDPQSDQEYLCTNGQGSFCSGLVSGGNSRRYHGVLCASLSAPTERFMMVNHLIESVFTEDKAIPISQEFYINEQAKPFVPANFTNTPYPVWNFLDANFSLEKKCWMTQGENTTNLVYTNTGKEIIKLSLKPLLGLRNYHHLRQNKEDLETFISDKKMTVRSNLPTVYFSQSKGEWNLNEYWYYNNFYTEEEARGYDFSEKLFNPGEIEITLKPGEKFSSQISLENTPLPIDKSLKIVEKNYADLNKLKLGDWGKDVVSSAQQCVVFRESTKTKTILAGYPWFTDWGRDTLISLRSFQYFLPKQEIESIVLAFLKHEKDGLIPNRFPDKKEEEIEYNTVDATLWIFVVLSEVFDSGSNKKFLKSLSSVLERIIRSHLKGTHFNIKCDAETGFLHAGIQGQQLTWMDARIGEKVVTPRSGYPVEIQALWYNALKIYLKITGENEEILSLTKKIESNFETYFWNEDLSILNDFLDENFTPNTQIRPNQIYALSLPFELLGKDKSKKIINTVQAKLLTPLGLRTLDEKDPEFKNEYAGDQWHRDHAYHQGTVWPFLLQDYWRASEKIYGTEAVKKTLSKDIKPLLHHFYHTDGIGAISEVFDGKDPKEGKGCPNQAWSLASLVWAANKLK